MKKTLTQILAITVTIIALYSCSKEIKAVDNLKKSCLYDSKIDYFKKWANTFTEIDTYNSTGTTIQSKSVIYPLGYFQLNSNSTYNVLSDNVPLSGKWDVTDSCKLLLDAGLTTERYFDVLKLSNDSLVIRRKANNIVYTQHYIPYVCPNISLLEFRWDNTTITSSYYNSAGIVNSSVEYPNGFFTLNADNTYDRVSNGDELKGTWLIDDNCKLVLDKSTSLERAFDIQKLTPDSLIIWRKDTVAMVNYLQKYKKH